MALSMVLQMVEPMADHLAHSRATQTALRLAHSMATPMELLMAPQTEPQMALS